MKSILIAVSLITFIMTISAVQADQRTATFFVDKMFCAMCPLTVRIAMEKVDGVETVEVDLESKSAIVTYDDDVVSPDRIANASTQAGYPAELNL